MVPEEWKEMPIRALLADQTPGFWGSPTDDGDSGTAVLRSTNIRDDGFLDLSDVACRKIPSRKIQAKALKPGDILLEDSGGGPNKPVGRVAIFERDGSDPYLPTNFLRRLRPDPECSSPRYVFYLLWHLHDIGRTKTFQHQTTGIRNLDYKGYLSWECPIPPLPEQKKIAAILSSVDDAIAATREVIEQTKRVKWGLLQDLMTQGIGHTRFKKTEIGEIPEEWEVVQLGSLIKSLNPGVSVKSQDRTIEGNEVGVLKTGAVSEGRFLPSEHKVVLPEERDRVRVSPKAGRIIISRMNTRQLVGESGLVREDYPKLFLPDRLWQTEFYRSADFNPEWLALALTAPPIRERIRLLGTGTSGSMKNIAQTKFLSLKIPYPPTNEQEEMATAVRALQHTSVGAEKSVAKLSQLKRGLMQDLLTGRVRVPID